MSAPHVTLVVCAAPLAERSAEVAASLISEGWRVRVVTTPSAIDWIPFADVELVTGMPPISRQRGPGTARSWPTDTATVVAPLTFNTLNKWAAGVTDNYALGILNEAISLRRRTIAVPVIGDRFWGHPIMSHSLEFLRRAGVTAVDPNGGKVADLRPVPSGTGVQVAAAFDVKWLLLALQGTT